MKTKLCIALAAFAMLAACKKEIKPRNMASPQADNAVGSSPANRSGAAVIVTADVLDFKTVDDFNSLVQTIGTDQSEYTAIGFTSLYTVFGQAMEAELNAQKDFADGYGSVEEAIEHQDEYTHPSAYSSNTDIMLDATFDDGEHYTRMNIYSSVVAKLVNKYGFVIIEDRLFRFTKDSVFVSDSTYHGSASRITPANTHDIQFTGTPVAGRLTGECICGNGFYKWATIGGGSSIRRMQLEVTFQQNVPLVILLHPSRKCYSSSTLIITGTYYARKTFGGYVVHNADKMIFQGGYTASRSLNGVQNFSNALGTWGPSSFNNVYTVSLYHFYDSNLASSGSYLSCLALTSGIYKVFAQENFGAGLSTFGPVTVSW